MACANPIKVRNKSYSNKLANFMFDSETSKHFITDLQRYLQKDFVVPCGKCLNCRVDKQNWLDDACNYEYESFDYIGAFVTVTYDDLSLIRLGFENEQGEVCFSLCRKDLSDYVKRLRSALKYIHSTHPENLFKKVLRSDFKVLYSGEYGDIFGRPHGHFVFFGLDFDYCRNIFRKHWPYGSIKVQPIKKGCFKYVTKYLTKQLGDSLYQEFDAKGYERPFCVHSIHFGRGLIESQLHLIPFHNYCYKNYKGVYRPIPYYFANILKCRPSLEQSFQITNDAMCIFYKTQKHYSLHEINEYRHQQALLRNERILVKMSVSEQKGFKKIKKYVETPIPSTTYEKVRIRSKKFKFNASKEVFSYA